MTLALSGYRIVDFTQVFAGPFATQQLAQLGAEVIKVEPPGTGDTTRGGLIEPAEGRVPAGFVTCNLGKQSLTLNLKSAEGLDIARQLIRTADAVVENFRPGVMDRLGLGYDAVQSLKPDIVYCSVSGYGQTGPKAARPAFDGAIQAASGMMSITGHPDVGPMRTGFFAVDMATAMNAAFAITAALLRRERTGEGQRLDVAMTDTAISLIGPQMSAYLANGTVPPLYGNRSPTGQPTANVFPTADGHLQVVGLKDNHARLLFDVVGLPEMANTYPGARDRIKNYDTISDALHARFATQTTSHWHDALLDAGVPVSEVRTLPEMAADPQLYGRRALVDVPLTNHSDTVIRTVAGGHQANVDAPTVPGSAPTLGEHNDRILAALGYSTDDIQRMRKDGTI